MTEGAPHSVGFRNRVTGALSNDRSQTLNLYLVNDRKETAIAIVVANCSEAALDYCREIGLDNWALNNTVTRRVQRNIGADLGVLDIVQMHGRTDRFRVNLSAKKDNPNQSRRVAQQDRASDF